MTRQLPLFPPLFAPIDWWRPFISEFLLRREGGEESRQEAAISAANAACGLKPRDWMRFQLAEEVRLSVPVQGSASALKNAPPAGWLLSREAPREERKIRSTWATLLGPLPFCRHLLPLLLPEGIFSEGKPASEVCGEIFTATMRILGLNDPRLCADLRERLQAADPRLRELRYDICSNIPAGTQTIQLLMRLGPDAILFLLPPF